MIKVRCESWKSIEFVFKNYDVKKVKLKGVVTDGSNKLLALKFEVEA